MHLAGSDDGAVGAANTLGAEVAVPDGAIGTAAASSGWYPDPEDAAGLRFWDGRVWTEHRARLSLPAVSTSGPAVCSCGVVAIGRCRICSDAYCHSHISATAVDDRPFRTRWEAWTCGNCIEDSQRQMRALQLARCENVSLQMQRIPKLKNVRTPNGKRPPLVSLFQHPRKATERPPRYAEAYLIEYDGGPPQPRFEGLALSQDGSTVYNVGLPVTGVPKDRFGPKRSITGYIVKNVIDVELLDEAARRSTKDPWFEFAARSFLRVAHHIGIKPDFSLVFDPPTEPGVDPVAEAQPDALDEHRDDDHSSSDEPMGAELADDHQPISSAAGLIEGDVMHDGVDLHDHVHDHVQSVEIEPDPNATVQLQAPVTVRQPDPPLSPPLPLPHP